MYKPFAPAELCCVSYPELRIWVFQFDSRIGLGFEEVSNVPFEQFWVFSPEKDKKSFEI